MVKYRIDRALDSISNKIGIISSLNAIESLNGDPKCFNYSALANAIYYNTYKIKARSCNSDENNAILGTIGEALERYSACFYDYKEQIISDYNNLNQNAINPQSFALFSKEQFFNKKFPFKYFDSDTVLSWFPTNDLTTGLETYVPGQFIYMPFTKDKNIVTPNVSTGLAAHNNIYDAILNGLYEVIERDSFVLSWYQMIPLKKILIDENIRNYINKQILTECQIYLFDITTDLMIPSVLALGFIENEFGKKFICGAATRWTYSEAIRKALQEFIQAISISRIQSKIMGSKRYKEFSDITSFDDHAWFYMNNPEYWGIFDNWFSSNTFKKVSFEEKDTITTKEKISKIVEILAKKKYNVCVKDTTTIDLRQLGYHSVKVVVPQLLPLSGNYNYYFLGGERLYTVPEKLGFKTKHYEGLNPYPHPFP